MRSERPKGAPPRPRDDGSLRLSQFLASSGLGSRRSVEEYIAAERIVVNGQVATHPGLRIRAEHDHVFLDGERVRLPRRWVYLAMNKPSGIVTTRSDEQGRSTVDDLLGRHAGRVAPIGRLDRSTEGLLLFTNHGELAHRLLHPRFRQPRTYLAWVVPTPSPLALKDVERGIAIGRGEHSGPAEVRLLSRRGAAARVRITLREGKNREVRRIFRALGSKVLNLRRIAYAGIELADLPVGSIRALTPAEVRYLAERTALVL